MHFNLITASKRTTHSAISLVAKQHQKTLLENLQSWGVDFMRVGGDIKGLSLHPLNFIVLLHNLTPENVYVNIYFG